MEKVTDLELNLESCSGIEDREGLSIHREQIELCPRGVKTAQVSVSMARSQSGGVK